MTGDTSSDPEGPVASYLWDFGDGGTSTQANPNHTYAAAGSYPVSLKVTDAGGVSDTATQTIQVSTAGIGYVGSDAAQGNATNLSVTVPSGISGGDGLVLVTTVASATVTATAPAGWTQVGQTTSGGTTSTVWQRVAVGGDAGSSVKVTYSALAKATVSLFAYTGTSATAPVLAAQGAGETVSRAGHTTPTVAVSDNRAWALSYWADNTSATTTWNLPGECDLAQYRVRYGRRPHLRGCCRQQRPGLRQPVRRPHGHGRLDRGQGGHVDDPPQAPAEAAQAPADGEVREVHAGTAGLGPVTATRTSAQSGTRVTARTLLRPGWPLAVLFYGFPLWWALGLAHFIFFIASVPMGIELLRRSPVRAPRWFGIWLVFLVWVLFGTLTLWTHAPGTQYGGRGRPAGQLRAATTCGRSLRRSCSSTSTTCARASSARRGCSGWSGGCSS